jgi:hypothetical protein
LEKFIAGGKFRNGLNNQALSLGWRPAIFEGTEVAGLIKLKIEGICSES